MVNDRLQFFSVVFRMGEGNLVLVVEDNDFVRMQIAGYLKESGCRILEASDVDSALDHMANDTVDLAIVDIRMEPVGGFEFIREIRSRDIGTPVILVTGDQTPDLLEKAGQLGVAAVLMKPVQKERLVRTVERTIEKSKRLA